MFAISCIGNKYWQMSNPMFSSIRYKSLNFEKFICNPSFGRMRLSKRSFSSEPAKSKLHNLVLQRFSEHPFSKNICKSNSEKVMREYLAMSQAFPYLQSASQKDLIFDVMEKNIDMPQQVEKTTVVGNFLSWDETGGHYTILKRGMSGLPQILNTYDNFHANLLKKDLEKIFNKKISPNYGPDTYHYLSDLYKNLSSLEHYERCATMVAFEMHAHQMIEALWNSLSNSFSLNKEELTYRTLEIACLK